MRSAKFLAVLLFLTFVLVPLAEAADNITPYFSFDRKITGSSGSKNIHDFSKALNDFLISKGYRRWKHDKGWRITSDVKVMVKHCVEGKKDEPDISVEERGIHPISRVYYSPGVYKWLRGEWKTIPDGEMIIKETRNVKKAMTSIVKQLCKKRKEGFSKDVRVSNDSVIPESFAENWEAEGWAVMVKFTKGSWDGWFWGDYGLNDNSFYMGRSAVTTEFPMPSNPAVNWNNYVYDAATHKGHKYPPSYPTGEYYGAIVHMSYGFGAYCLNCHASAERESTFSALDNLAGEPGHPLNFQLDISFAVDQGKDMSGIRDNPPGKGHTEIPPFHTPNRQFLEMFKQFGDKGVSWREVWDRRLPAKTYDHVVARGHKQNDVQFLTSDQCQPCHSAAGLNSDIPSMQFKGKEEAYYIDISPYGEWQASMMGLAGRDPVFFSQLESEQNYYPKKTNWIADTCFTCHGVMGKRQMALDRKGSDSLPKCFTRDIVDAYPDKDPKNLAKYGSLARDGISCTVCHHMDGEKMGTEPFTGEFSIGSASKIYGPYPTSTMKPKPMQNALGVAPVEGKQIKRSGLCGSCHVVKLPVWDQNGAPILENDKEKHIYEQTTYLEWRNSIYQDENSVTKDSKQARTCQDCHMPKDYQGQLLAQKIASFQDATFPKFHGSLNQNDIDTKRRYPFSRHSLTGINLFALEMFRQFPLILGIQEHNYLNKSTVQPPFIMARKQGLEFAGTKTASVEVTSIKKSRHGLKVDVKVTNKAGHFFPSGVSFRRALLEFVILDKGGGVMWASGRTNEAGVIVEGTGNTPLPTEFLKTDGRVGGNYQPHYEQITRPYQVQIYEELVGDSRGQITTSFLGIDKSIKDNRLRPKGFKTHWNKKYDPHLKAHGVGNDSDYVDDKDPLWGGDKITYAIELSPEKMSKAKKVRLTLYYQALPPYYLMHRFEASGLGLKKNDDIQRLYFIASHLNTGAQRGAEGPVKDWKLQIAAAEKNL